MKKTMLAAALIAGFAGVAQAESSVTLYGLLDAGVGYQNVSLKQNNADGSTTTTKSTEIGFRNGVKDGPRWGLKGVDDLGNGTSSTFQLEGAVDVGTGGTAPGTIFNRVATVGLMGDSWGALTLGRQLNPDDTMWADVDPLMNIAGASNTAFGSSYSTRMDNSIKYLSPVMGGFHFGAAWSGTNKTVKSDGVKVLANSVSKNWIALAAGYNIGKLQLGAAYDTLRNESYTNGVLDSNATGSTRVNAWNLGATYNFDVVKLHAMYGQQRNGAIDGYGRLSSFLMNGNTDPKGIWGPQASKGLVQQSWMAAVSVPFDDAGSRVAFEYAGSSIKNKEIADFGVVKANAFSVGAIKNLSKRTSIIGFATYGKGNKRYEASTVAKVTQTAVQVGLQHRF